MNVGLSRVAIYPYGSCSVVPDSLRPHGLWPTRFFCSWNFPGKNTGVGCNFLLQGIFQTQGSNPDLLHFRQILYGLSHWGRPVAVAQGLNSCGFWALEHRFSSGTRTQLFCSMWDHPGSNLCLLHWQADSLPLRHQGSPGIFTLLKCFIEKQIQIESTLHL